MRERLLEEMLLRERKRDVVERGRVSEERGFAERRDSRGMRERERRSRDENSLI